MHTRTRTLTLLAVALLGLMALPGRAGIQDPDSTAFTYQGFLRENGLPANGTFRLLFQLQQVATGEAVGAALPATVQARNGVFTTKLDFGPVFDGTRFELAIAVNDGQQVIPLDPPQPICPTPEALFAQVAGSASSVPDSALSPNVPIIIQSVLRLSDPGSRLVFGPTDDRSIGIDPAGSTGLLLRDPNGIRIHPLDPLTQPRLLFGPTDRSTIGRHASMRGLVLRDEEGVRIVDSSGTGRSTLLFGDDPDDLCTVSIDPLRPGLILADPSGVRIVDPSGIGRSLLRFGDPPDDLCTIGVNPQLPGLQVTDPNGLRLLIPPGAANAPRLLFGPTDECTIGIDPDLVGLLLRDVNGVRIVDPGALGTATLRFGDDPDDLCTVSIDPQRPGLILEDPNGVRIVDPSAAGKSTLRFGDPPDDLCTIGVNPQMPGLLFTDPNGVRLLTPGATNAPRLLFGPTDECTIGIDPDLVGLLLRDPNGVRIVDPGGTGKATLRFGDDPDDLCTVGVDPAGLAGLVLGDPGGIRVVNPLDASSPQLLFGPTDECRLLLDPLARGLNVVDPDGLRLRGKDQKGMGLTFGPTDLCRISVDPLGPSRGLMLADPDGIRVMNPLGGAPRLLFGPTDECRITVASPPVGGNSLMTFTDPNGFLFQGNAEVAGTLTVERLIEPSSRRLKKDIRPLEDPLALIGKLQGVRYTWKAKEENAADIGFIAEEVAEVFPEVVAMTEDGTQTVGVNYGHLVAVAVEGIKAQQGQIRSLRAENDEMKERMQRLEKALELFVKGQGNDEAL